MRRLPMHAWGLRGPYKTLMPTYGHHSLNQEGKAVYQNQYCFVIVYVCASRLDMM
jgi:hypothetical protein